MAVRPVRKDYRLSVMFRRTAILHGIADFRDVGIRFPVSPEIDDRHQQCSGRRILGAPLAGAVAFREEREAVQPVVLAYCARRVDVGHRVVLAPAWSEGKPLTVGIFRQIDVHQKRLVGIPAEIPARLLAHRIEDPLADDDGVGKRRRENQRN